MDLSDCMSEAEAFFGLIFLSASFLPLFGVVRGIFTLFRQQIGRVLSQLVGR